MSQLSGMVAPLSGNSVGLQRGQVTNGIRELILCKGVDKKVGLRVKDISNGVFVTIVVKDSPAALAGLRFGDQVMNDCVNILKYSELEPVEVVVDYRVHKSIS